MSSLCTACQAHVPDGFRLPGRSFADAGDWERLREILCRRCGRVLPAEVRPAVQATFSVLTRFGLTDSGRPILYVPAGHPAQFWPGDPE